MIQMEGLYENMKHDKDPIWNNNI